MAASDYIYGLHDRGGEHLYQGRGYTLVSEELRHTDWQGPPSADTETIARLNWGYYPNGTIAPDDQMGTFATRCGEYARRFPLVNIYTIGNEPNKASEWPNGKAITPLDYAECFVLCRDAIKRANPNAIVCMGAVAPWNIESGDCIRYFEQVLTLLAGDLDGITIHAYARTPNPADITSEARWAAPYGHWHAGFRCYQDFMRAIPESLRHLPVYLTEMNQNAAWVDVDNGWVSTAYDEINRWNQENAQQIRCALLYRWLKHDQWAIDGKGRVQADFRRAVERGYQWRQNIPSTGRMAGYLGHAMTVAAFDEKLAASDFAKEITEIILHHSATRDCDSLPVLDRMMDSWEYYWRTTLGWTEGVFGLISQCGFGQFMALGAPNRGAGFASKTRLNLEVLGTFTTIPPTGTQWANLVQVCAAIKRHAQHDVTITTHRDYNPSTQCPGDAFLAKVPQLIQEIEASMVDPLIGYLESPDTIEEARRIAYEAVGITGYIKGSALTKAAREDGGHHFWRYGAGVGRAISNECKRAWKDRILIVQGFEDAIAYCVEGHYDPSQVRLVDW